MKFSKQIGRVLAEEIMKLTEESHEEHPFHQAAVDAGLKHNFSHTIGAKTIHHYLPDHHWKTGVQLVTHKRKGSADKHEWRGNNMAGGKDVESMKQHLANDKAGYDQLVAHHKAGTGPFKS